MHATIVELWEAVFSVGSSPRLYLEYRNTANGIENKRGTFKDGDLYSGLLEVVIYLKE
jgi:hypothetical protein